MVPLSDCIAFIIRQKTEDSSDRFPSKRGRNTNLHVLCVLRERMLSQFLEVVSRDSQEPSRKNQTPHEVIFHSVEPRALGSTFSVNAKKSLLSHEITVSLGALPPDGRGGILSRAWGAGQCGSGVS